MSNGFECNANLDFSIQHLYISARNAMANTDNNMFKFMGALNQTIQIRRIVECGDKLHSLRRPIQGSLAAHSFMKICSHGARLLPTAAYTDTIERGTRTELQSRCSPFHAIQGIRLSQRFTVIHSLGSSFVLDILSPLSTD